MIIVTEVVAYHEPRVLDLDEVLLHQPLDEVLVLDLPRLGLVVAERHQTCRMR